MWGGEEDTQGKWEGFTQYGWSFYVDWDSSFEADEIDNFVGLSDEGKGWFMVEEFSLWAFVLIVEKKRVDSVIVDKMVVCLWLSFVFGVIEGVAACGWWECSSCVDYFIGLICVCWEVWDWVIYCGCV